jgi:hypothetical protein
VRDDPPGLLNALWRAPARTYAILGATSIVEIYTRYA